MQVLPWGAVGWPSSGRVVVLGLLLLPLGDLYRMERAHCAGTLRELVEKS